ncbi:SHOCT domain-containing protein [Streptomyces sannanensis]
MARRGPGLIRGAARTAVVAGTATAVSGRVQRRQEERFAQQDAAQAQAQQAQAQQAPPATPGEDLLSQLERLGALRAQGVLTPEEFEAQKARLLGR